MIRFEAPDEPADFDTRVRQKGMQWMADRPGWKELELDLPSYWTDVLDELKDAYKGLCAYSCLIESFRGTVDHYLSKQKDHRPDLAFEWSNYRFCSATINQRKGNKDDRILDPHEVEDDWFIVQIPSMHLLMTDRVPEEVRARAEFTLSKAGINLMEDSTLAKSRLRVLKLYFRTGRSRAVLAEECPLLLRAVDDPANEQALETLEQELRGAGQIP